MGESDAAVPGPTATTVEADGVSNGAPPAPARDGSEGCGDLIAPQHYKVQFTATEEYVRLVKEAKALLSHAAPRANLQDIHLRAMRAFVETLRKRKYGSRTTRRASADTMTDDASRENVATVDAAPADGTPADATPADAATEHLRSGPDAEADTSAPSQSSLVNGSPESSTPRQRGRHIPADTRRAVAARDGYRCTYVDASGTRCAETHLLEFHHVVPFALKPAHEISNLTLRCRAHNALAAEQDFGRDFVRQQTTAARHDPFREHGP